MTQSGLGAEASQRPKTFLPELGRLSRMGLVANDHQCLYSCRRQKDNKPRTQGQCPEDTPQVSAHSLVTPGPLSLRPSFPGVAV